MNTIYIIFVFIKFFDLIGMNSKTKAIIFARVSSVSDRQNNERQILDLTGYAEKNNFEIVEIFKEQISGAKKNKERIILLQALEYCQKNNIKFILISELSRLGRNALEVLEIIKNLVDLKINLYIQKENIKLLEDSGEVAIFTPILIATLSTCAQLERDNIKFRLNSGREQYKKKGGELGRKKGSIKTKEQKEIQYKGVIKRLKNGEKIRDIAKLENVGISTVQRVKNEFNL